MLVAHAFDMPRANAEFTAQGIAVVRAPTGVSARGADDMLDYLPNITGLQGSYYALYEFLAWLVDGAVRVFLGAEDVSEAIRTPEMSMGASAVSAHAPVREALVSKQREMGEAGGVVLEGRDTGTVVFPDAEAKFFLDAAAAVRAVRRYRELGPAGGQSYEAVLSDVLRRDVQDSTRENSPLRMADDAVYIDTTTLSAGEVVEAILRRLPGGAG